MFKVGMIVVGKSGSPYGIINMGCKLLVTHVDNEGNWFTGKMLYHPKNQSYVGEEYEELQEIYFTPIVRSRNLPDWF